MNHTLVAIAYMLLLTALVVVHMLWMRVILFGCLILLVTVYARENRAK